MSRLFSDRVLFVAAAGYRLAAEMDDPILDANVRTLYRRRLADAVARLSADDRQMLADIADIDAADDGFWGRYTSRTDFDPASIEQGPQ